MSVRKFYLLQCPASTFVSTYEDCHRHAENVTFALLREYFWSFHGRWLPNWLQTHIKVVASQVSREPSKNQSTVANPKHCGHCLLHAVCGELTDHHFCCPYNEGTRDNMHSGIDDKSRVWVHFWTRCAQPVSLPSQNPIYTISTRILSRLFSTWKWPGFGCGGTRDLEHLGSLDRH